MLYLNINTRKPRTLKIIIEFKKFSKSKKFSD